MQYSGNYKFLIPDGDDVADIADINNNTKAIDAELWNNKTAIQQVADDIGNGVLTIYQNGDSKGSFSANQTKNAIVHISVPTKVSQLEDDANLASISNKVDKIAGKGLSTNDYTAMEKTKLAGIAEGANKYTLPAATSTALGGIKVGTNLSILNGVLTAKDTTYLVATTSADGLMSSTDKAKLDGVATGANKITVDTTFNNASTNPIANAAVTAQFASIAPDIVSLKTSVANINKSLSDSDSDTETIAEATFTSWLTKTT